jgi:hypothetical protein
MESKNVLKILQKDLARGTVLYPSIATYMYEFTDCTLGNRNNSASCGLGYRGSVLGEHQYLHFVSD